MLSFEESYLAYHRRLNPKLFDGNKLRADVRQVLLKIANAWIEFASIPEDAITDIIFTGGNAQFNYTRFSDIDVHVVIKKKKMPIKAKFLNDFLDDKKTLWTLTHHNKVKGYTVELYAQDSADKLAAAGVYSLQNNAWIHEPVAGHYDFTHDAALKSKVDTMIALINKMIREKFPEAEFETLKHKIKDMRKAALASGDEFSFENLVFKSLRNSGVLDRMNAYIASLKDKELSLD